MKIYSVLVFSIVLALSSCINGDIEKSDDIEEHISQAKHLLNEDNFAEALLLLNKCLKLEPNNCEALKGAIVAKSELGDFIGIVKMSRHMHCYHPRHLFEIGYAFENLDIADSAIFYYKLAIREDSSYLSANNNLANLYLKLQNLDSAIYWFNKAYNIDSSKLEVNANMGVLYGDMGLLESSIFHFNKAIDVCPTCDNLYYNRAIIKYNLGKSNEALIDLNKSLQLNDKNDLAWLNRGLIHYNLHNLDQACNDFKMAKDFGNAKGLYYFNDLCLGNGL